MRIGINGSGRLAQPNIDEIVGDVESSERDGFTSYWLAQTALADSLALLAIAGRTTSEIELGTAVVPTWTRHPEVMAAGALTAQAASAGRVVLGIGLAHQPSVEDRWGMTWERPVRHMSEYLSILDSLLNTGAASFQGDIWRLETESATISDRPPLVMLAALGEQMLKMAGSRTDGTILWCVGPTTLERQIVPVINEAADGAGRPLPRVVCSLPVCVTDDPDPTREFVGQILAGYATLPSYRAMLDIEGVHGVEDISLIGDEATVRSGLDAIGAAGATDFTAVVIPDRDGPDRTIDLLRSYGG
ncbi:MAG: TIGR03564 family F420-dependent LLM class oxidoreductase [Acidimicrobiia bacterium]|nr:TIGR03564 family F420-dependent LLM class oxidoreductase [Acidimicrobiia bacterium]